MVKILFFQSLYPVAFPLNTSELFFLMENLEKYITHRMLLRKALWPMSHLVLAKCPEYYRSESDRYIMYKHLTFGKRWYH